MEKKLADLGGLCLRHLSLNSDIIGLDSIIHDTLVKITNEYMGLQWALFVRTLVKRRTQR